MKEGRGREGGRGEGGREGGEREGGRGEGREERIVREECKVGEISEEKSTLAPNMPA